MKALIYKELKLAVHPLCYVLLIFFSIVILVPSYPTSIAFIYVLPCYTFLFLGVNKGQQTNDLLFSTLMPVRKKDIVLIRIFTVIYLQLLFIIFLSVLFPIAIIIRNSIDEVVNIGLDLNGFVSIISFAIICYSIADLLFFPIYYRNGKSLVLSSLISFFSFSFIFLFFTLILPILFNNYKDFFCNKGLGIQFGFLAISLIISFLIHLFTYKLSCKLFEKVDF